MRIAQVSRSVGPGGGVGGVAENLRVQFHRLGVESVEITSAVERLFEKSTHARVRKFGRVLSVLVFSFSAPLKEMQLRRRGFVTISHNDCLTGDIYVNHGLHKALLMETGVVRAIFRNPLHGFLLARESVRHRLGTYRVIVCFSREEERRLRATYRIRRPVVHVPNGVDTSKFKAAESQQAVRAELGLRHRRRYLLFVGHEFDRKGLARILDELPRLETDVELLVVGGDATAVTSWSRRVASAGLRDRVHFVGSRSDVAKWFAAADVFVFPSAFESFGLVILEAMAAGLPVVVSEASAAGGFVVDDVNGLIVAENAYHAAISRCLASPGLRSRLAEAGRETAVKLSWEQIASQYLALARSIR